MPNRRADLCAQPPQLPASRVGWGALGGSSRPVLYPPAGLVPADAGASPRFSPHTRAGDARGGGGVCRLRSSPELHRAGRITIIGRGLKKKKSLSNNYGLKKLAGGKENPGWIAPGTRAAVRSQRRAVAVPHLDPVGTPHTSGAAGRRRRRGALPRGLPKPLSRGGNPGERGRRGRPPSAGRERSCLRFPLGSHLESWGVCGMGSCGNFLVLFPSPLWSCWTGRGRWEPSWCSP